MNRLTSRLSYANATAAVCAFLVLGGGTAALATSGGETGPTAQIAKKKKTNRYAGAYQGTTEEGGTVSFRITRKGLVVGFTMPNVPVYCRMVGNQSTYPGTPFTITAPTMKIQKGPEGGPQFFYEDPIDTSQPHQGIHVDGKGAPGGMKGNASMISGDGGAGRTGTTECNTQFVDWNAHKVGGKK